jgi:hypothetical protein
MRSVKFAHRLSLARVHLDRDSVLVRQGWATQQQGETDRVNYAAQQQAKQVNDVAIQAQRPNCWYCASRRPTSESSPRSTAS